MAKQDYTLKLTPDTKCNFSLQMVEIVKLDWCILFSWPQLQDLLGETTRLVFVQFGFACAACKSQNDCSCLVQAVQCIDQVSLWNKSIYFNQIEFSLKLEKLQLQ